MPLCFETVAVAVDVDVVGRRGRGEPKRNGALRGSAARAGVGAASTLAAAGAVVVEGLDGENMSGSSTGPGVLFSVHLLLLGDAKGLAGVFAGVAIAPGIASSSSSPSGSFG